MPTMTTAKQAVGYLLLIAVFFAALILIPIGLFWSLKTLGIITVKLTPWTWLAAFVLTGFLLNGSANKSS